MIHVATVLQQAQLPEKLLPIGQLLGEAVDARNKDFISYT